MRHGMVKECVSKTLLNLETYLQHALEVSHVRVWVLSKLMQAYIQSNPFKIVWQTVLLKFLLCFKKRYRHTSNARCFKSVRHKIKVIATSFRWDGHKSELVILDFNNSSVVSTSSYTYLPYWQIPHACAKQFQIQNNGSIKSSLLKLMWPSKL